MDGKGRSRGEPHQPVPGLRAENARQHQEHDTRGGCHGAAPQDHAQRDGECRGEPKEEPGADDDPGQVRPTLREEVVPVAGQDTAGDDFRDRGCEGSGDDG